jgi:nucleoside-triphosphatase
LKNLFFVTGPPGIGKTTIILQTVDFLKTRGFKVGGMASREVREKGTRVGFEIVDISSEKTGCLAHVDQPEGPKVGKYRVNLKDLDSVGTNSILEAVCSAHIVVVDELGPMELHSSAFKEAISRATNINKPVLGAIHQRARDPLIDGLRKREDAEILKITYENRATLHNLLIEKIIQFLEEKRDQLSQDGGFGDESCWHR